MWAVQNQAWAKTMIDHLGAIKTAVDTARPAGQTALTAVELDCFHVRYLQIVDAGYAQNPAPEPPLAPSAAAAASRAKPVTSSTGSGITPAASSPLCATSRCRSTTTSPSGICE